MRTQNSHNFGESWDDRAAARRNAPSGQMNENAENTRCYKNVIVTSGRYGHFVAIFFRLCIREAERTLPDLKLKMLIRSRQRNLMRSA